MEMRLIFLNFYFLVTGDEINLEEEQKTLHFSKKSPEDCEKLELYRKLTQVGE